MKSSKAMILAAMDANFSNCVEKPDKFRTKNLSSIMNEMIYETNHILNCRYEIKYSYDPHSYGRNFSNCAYRSLKNSGLQREMNP